MKSLNKRHHYIVFEGIVLPISGYEDNYLEIIESHEWRFPPDDIGITDLIGEAAKREILRKEEIRAFEQAYLLDDPSPDKGPSLNTYTISLIEKYRKSRKRKYPPLFKVRIQVEAEIADEAITTKWWEEINRETRKNRENWEQEWKDDVIEIEEEGRWEEK